MRVLGEYRTQIEKAGAQKLRFVGTSAMRDASNGAAFMARVEELLGVAPEVVPGVEEAELAFKGAVTSLRGPVSVPILLTDIGGGSTEFVRGTSRVESSLSVDMGSVRVTERFQLRPGDSAATKQARAWVDAQLDDAEKTVPFAEVGSLVGTAGTVTTVAAYALGLEEYNPEISHGQLLTWDEWASACQFMIEAPVAEKAALPYMPPGRADVIGAGALIWQQILRRVEREAKLSGRALGGAYVSEHDVLDGIALSLLH